MVQGLFYVPCWSCIPPAAPLRDRSRTGCVDKQHAYDVTAEKSWRVGIHRRQGVFIVWINHCILAGVIGRGRVLWLAYIEMHEMSMFLAFVSSRSDALRHGLSRILPVMLDGARSKGYARLWESFEDHGRRGMRLESSSYAFHRFRPSDGTPRKDQFSHTAIGFLGCSYLLRLPWYKSCVVGNPPVDQNGEAMLSSKGRWILTPLGSHCGCHELLRPFHLNMRS